MLELYYDISKQLFSTFNYILEIPYHIEDFSIKKGDIVLNKDKNGNENGKDKNKLWNRNIYVVNDDVVNVPKIKETTFNLANAILATKQQETIRHNDSSKSQTTDKPKNSYKPKCSYTLMVDSYDAVLKTLLANKLITLLDNS